MKFVTITIFLATVTRSLVFCAPQCESCASCTVPNEEFQSCGTNCPKTCDNLAGGPCTPVCVPGCYCKSGYVRNNVDGSCVLPENCPCVGTTIFSETATSSEQFTSSTLTMTTEQTTSSIATASDTSTTTTVETTTTVLSTTSAELTTTTSAPEEIPIAIIEEPNNQSNPVYSYIQLKYLTNFVSLYSSK